MKLPTKLRVIPFTLFSALPHLASANPAPAPLPTSSPGGLIVNTHQGYVQGTLSSLTVRQFLGIPYATAQRWQAPQVPPTRRDVFGATSYGDSCIQQIDAGGEVFLKLVGGAGLNVTESEACQSLNIWAPIVTRKQKTAVLVWIYGGGFVFGTSNVKQYDGTNFVKNHDDLIIVSFNYRLNIFGQPNAPQLQGSSTAQNFGLLDVEAAIKWVYDNIASFGGDPDRISIFGQSAGAVAADLYTLSHPNDAIVKGVILQSGIAAAVSPLSQSPVNPAGWNAVADAVGCGRATDEAQLGCMKAVPFKTLKNAVLSTNSTFNLVADDKTVFRDTAARLATGNFLRVPSLGGTTQHEADIYVVGPQLLSPGFSMPTVSQILADASTLIGFTCPVGISAANRLRFEIPTWRYQYQGVFPNVSPRDDLRAYHAAEIPLVFNTLESGNTGIPSTSAEKALSTLMQQVWATFAQDPRNGLVERLGLPVYNPVTPSLIQFGNAMNQSGVVFTSGQRVDAGCGNVTALSSIVALARSLLG